MINIFAGLEQDISGVIFYEETLYQNADDGTPFVDVLKSKGIIPRIKVKSIMEDSVDSDSLVLADDTPL